MQAIAKIVGPNSERNMLVKIVTCPASNMNGIVYQVTEKDRKKIVSLDMGSNSTDGDFVLIDFKPKKKICRVLFPLAK